MANDFSRFFFLDVRCGNQIPINATVVLNANIWDNNSSAAAAAATRRLVYVSTLSLSLSGNTRAGIVLGNAAFPTLFRCFL